MPKLSADHPYFHEGVEEVVSRYGRYVEIGAHSRLNNVFFDDYAYCDRMADIANTTIGKFANIAAFTRIGPTDHPLDTASCHHFLYRSAYYFENAQDDQDWFEKRAARLCVIGHDTWIGHGAIIKPEVTIGHGAVVASGAVVTKDVAPYTIVAGVTATPLKRRQPEHIAQRLIELAWWDWDHARLQAALPDFRQMSAEAFLEKYA